MIAQLFLTIQPRRAARAAHAIIRGGEPASWRRGASPATTAAKEPQEASVAACACACAAGTTPATPAALLLQLLLVPNLELPLELGELQLQRGDLFKLRGLLGEPSLAGGVPNTINSNCTTDGTTFEQSVSPESGRPKDHNTEDRSRVSAERRHSI